MKVRLIILGGIFTLGLLGATSYMVTYAYFTDTAVSATNTFTAATEFPTATPTPEIAEKVLITEVSADDDWIELLNVSGGYINLSEWTIADNVGSDFLVGAYFGSGQRIVIKSKNSDLTGTDPEKTFTLSGAIGEGIAASGDKLVLIDKHGVEVDKASWGSNHDVFNSLPIIPSGKTLQRLPETQDTDTAADWKIGTPSAGLINSL